MRSTRMRGRFKLRFCMQERCYNFPSSVSYADSYLSGSPKCFSILGKGKTNGVLFVICKANYIGTEFVLTQGEAEIYLQGCCYNFPSSVNFVDSFPRGGKPKDCFDAGGKPKRAYLQEIKPSPLGEGGCEALG